jgi:hypothetical protein
LLPGLRTTNTEEGWKSFGVKKRDPVWLEGQVIDVSSKSPCRVPGCRLTVLVETYWLDLSNRVSIFTHMIFTYLLKMIAERLPGTALVLLCKFMEYFTGIRYKKAKNASS